MQGDSNNTVLPTSGHVVVTATMVHEGGQVGAAVAATAPNNLSGEEDKSIIRVDEGDQMSYGSNRWPRQETLALLKIRSDMDSVFRDSNLKGPLWEEVSRKLAELGYHRSAKKCKEKFENVYKYHKRTKEGRTGKSQGKTYKFFDQLQALENHHYQSQLPSPPTQPPPKPQPPIIAAATLPWSSNPPSVSHATVPLNNFTAPSPDPAINAMPISSSQPLNPSQTNFPSFQNLTSHLFSSSTSSSTASDEGFQGTRKIKKKRKWKYFFERLTKDVIKKQEELQRKFLETVEKHELERMAREEAWRMQEMSRIIREHEIFVHERTTAAAKDAAVIAFLQKISGQQNSIQILDIPQPPTSVAAPVPSPAPLPAPTHVNATAPPQPRPAPPAPCVSVVMDYWDVMKKDNGQTDDILRSSRWPKVEVEALINLRTNLDTKYQENGPKGNLWEEISSGMKKLGYNRSSKRCKEKWENINKYFKKVKESNKKRPEDSKTCPYFHQLDALYKEKSKPNESNNLSNYGGHASLHHPITTMEPLIARPEQQWPLQQQEKILMDLDADIEDDDDDNDGDTEEEDEGGGGSCFEVVASKPATSLGNGE
ncbi:hypothetical protein MANES_02G179200v8 [Manihot esculenta]|uniref:Myb-like domain-containing protein n=1 Tax=Manihot esculenta TaxID=3983 RepID=A0A2C9WGF5_MANES|nr:hypothetical protein MANES_02G179200v8 [Manihot esculenta]